MDTKQSIHSPLQEKAKVGIEISPGIFVINKGKFLRTQFIGIKSKSKIVRNASKILLMEYALKTGEDIDIPDDI